MCIKISGKGWENNSTTVSKSEERASVMQQQAASDLQEMLEMYYSSTGWCWRWQKCGVISWPSKTTSKLGSWPEAVAAVQSQNKCDSSLLKMRAKPLPTSSLAAVWTHHVVTCFLQDVVQSVGQVEFNQLIQRETPEVWASVGILDILPCKGVPPAVCHPHIIPCKKHD